MKLTHFIFWQLSICLLATVFAETNLNSKPQGPPPVDEQADKGEFGFYPTDTFITEIGVNAPRTNFVQWDDRCDDGLLYFITPRGWGISNPGPMLLDARGKMIWSKHFDNKFGGQAYDFTVQQYQGESYLTFWLGDDRVRGHGSGYYYMVSAK